MTESDRRAALERAGHNVLNLDFEDCTIDLFTDVPCQPFVESVRSAAVDGQRDPDLQALAAHLYGDEFLFVAATKGRTAERLLVGALERPGATVVTHGLFFTAQQALTQSGARVELAPVRSGGAPTADLDLDWLARRFAAGGVDIVYLEPCNNGLGGRTLTLESLAAAATLCKRHGALLILDAARLLTNCLALPGLLFETARAMTACADAFTVSCAKEHLVPFGSLVAVRDGALQRRAFAAAYHGGCQLEPHEARIRLGAGLAHMATHAEPVLRERRRLLHLAADELRAARVPLFEPVVSHALFVPIAPELLTDGAASARSLEALLYQRSGVRGLVLSYPAIGRTLLRLALPLARYGDEELRAAGRAVVELFARVGEAPRLVVKAEPSLHPSRPHYRVAD